jgi:transposase InsO family protein
MQVKLTIALARFSQGEAMNVRAVCGELGISPPTFYKYAKRFEDSGLPGLFELSRRPLSSPTQVTAAVEDLIVRWRKELADEGWDAGAVSIRSRMLRAGQDPPSVRTVHRVLVRRGLVVAAPAKRPRASYRSCEFTQTNGCWQTDATQCTLADGGPVTVFHLIDDRSRKSLTSVAAAAETALAAWECVSTAMVKHGIPAMMLSDNGSAFSAKLRGGEADFERRLRELGVNVVTSTPYHPQTCGKVERFHDTFKRWLDARDAPAGIAELQVLADVFDDLYNTTRPHQALDNKTPEEVWLSVDRCPPPTIPVQPQQRTATVTVSQRGVATIGRRYDVQLGREWERCTVTVIINGLHVMVFHKRRLIRELTLDPTRRYQPLPGPRGRRKQRIVSTMS